MKNIVVEYAATATLLITQDAIGFAISWLLARASSYSLKSATPCRALRRSAPCFAGLRQWCNYCLVLAAAIIVLDVRPRISLACRLDIRPCLWASLQSREPSAAARLRRGGLCPPFATTLLGQGSRWATIAAQSAHSFASAPPAIT
jgi:hypothetical protein